MHTALVEARLPSALSDDAGSYLCNFTLYRQLAASPLPSGFLHVPQARECDPVAMFDLADIERAVKVVAEAFAADLAVKAAHRLEAQRASQAQG
jgi:pyrrolidone-carboxylate peptidase